MILKTAAEDRNSNLVRYTTGSLVEVYFKEKGSLKMR